jgi:hypothetical protein
MTSPPLASSERPIVITGAVPCRATTTSARCVSELSEYRHGDSNADEEDGKPLA